MGTQVILTFSFLLHWISLKRNSAHTHCPFCLKQKSSLICSKPFSNYCHQYHILMLGIINIRRVSSPLKFPGKIAIDNAGQRLFISDSNNHRIVVTDLNVNILYIDISCTFSVDQIGCFIFYRAISLRRLVRLGLWALEMGHLQNANSIGCRD